MTASELVALAVAISGAAVAWLSLSRQSSAEKRAAHRDDFTVLQKELRDKVADLKADNDALREDVQRLTNRLDEVTRTLASRTAELADLTTEVGRLGTWKRLATDYIHRLRDALSASGADVPQPPGGLDL